MVTPTILLSLEVAIVGVVWLVTRLRGERPIHRRVRCPLDGQTARITLEDVDGPALPVNLVRCSLLEKSAARSCDRACLR
jgi:hypothetical protein